MAFEDEESGAIETREYPQAGDPAGGDRQAFHDPKYYEGLGRRGAQINDLPDAPEGAIDTGPTLNSPGYGPLAGVGNAAKGGIKRIVSYLMGEGAADPQSLDQVGAQVDPQGQMDPSDRNMAAVQKVAQEGGPAAAWKIVQANRVAYNAKQAFAYTALNGTQQKPPDLNAAIDAANQASSHVLDGSNVQFQPSEGGVTATVKTPGGEAQTIPLSMDAFRQYLNVGRTGQYDRVMQDTVPGLLQKLARGGGGMKRLDQMRPLKPKAPEEAPTGAPAYGADEETNFGKTPSTMNLSGNNKVQYGSMNQPAIEDASLDDRAQRMFPGVTQGPQAEAWKNAELGRGDANQNRVDVAAEKGRNDREKARITGGSRVAAEEIKAGASRDVAGIRTKGWMYATDGKRASAQIAADAKLAHDGNVDARQRLETARKSIATKRMTMEPLTEDEKRLEQQITAGGAATATPQSQQQPQAPQPQRPQAPQKQGSLATKDQQALAWANANPDDPRASKIKAQLGVQ